MIVGLIVELMVGLIVDSVVSCHCVKVWVVEWMVGNQNHYWACHDLDFEICLDGDGCGDGHDREVTGCASCFVDLGDTPYG